MPFRSHTRNTSVATAGTGTTQATTTAPITAKSPTNPTTTRRTRGHAVHHGRTAAYTLFAILSVIVLGLSGRMAQHAKGWFFFFDNDDNQVDAFTYSDSLKSSVSAVVAWSAIAFVYFVVFAVLALARTSFLISPLMDSICLGILFAFGLGVMAATSHFGPDAYPSVGKGMLGMGWLLVWLIFFWLLFTIFYTFRSGQRNWRNTWHSHNASAVGTGVGIGSGAGVLEKDRAHDGHHLPNDGQGHLATGGDGAMYPSMVGGTGTAGTGLTGTHGTGLTGTNTDTNTGMGTGLTGNGLSGNTGTGFTGTHGQGIGPGTDIGADHGHLGTGGVNPVGGGMQSSNYGTPPTFTAHADNRV